MTKTEAMNQIDHFASDPNSGVAQDQISDARKLIIILPDHAIHSLGQGSIRPDPIQADRIEFFWTRTRDVLTPGNRITRLQTLGSGRFSVLTGEPNAVQWQKSPEGLSMPEVLALDADGAELLIKQLVEWQVA